MGAAAATLFPPVRDARRVLTVLRLGHRPQRDKRLTTHVCLTARALGADRVLVDRVDPRVEATVEDVTARFGGPFVVEMGVRWRKTLRDHGGPTVHLTMYGELLDDVIGDLRDAWSPDAAGMEGAGGPEDLLVVVGAGKVPGDVYELVDRNVAVGNQPHSEVAALGVLLHALHGGTAAPRAFEDAQVRVVPRARGKQVEPADDAGDGAPEDGDDDA